MSDYGEVVVVCPGTTEGTIYAVSNSLVKQLNDEGIDAVCICLKAQSRFLIINYVYMIYSIFKNIKYDQNIILMHFDSILLCPLLRLLGFKSIFNVFHTDVVSYYKEVSLFKRVVLGFLIRLVRDELNVFVSRESMLKAKTYFKLTNATFIYNIFFPPKPIYSTNDTPSLRLGVVSRLSATKNISLVIKLVSKLVDRGYDIKLLIYGDGLELSNLRTTVEENGCYESIIFMGFSDNKQDIYSNIDALISLSSLEGLPTVILESIAYGKPVFHSDCSSGPREIMSPFSDPLVKTDTYESTNVGYLVRPINESSRHSDFSVDQLSDYLESFLMEYKQGRFSMDLKVEPFLASNISRQWKNLFKETCL